MEKQACEVEVFKLFAFGIGQFVTTQQEAELYSARGQFAPYPLKMKILKRNIEEGPTGSVDRFYCVRGFKNDTLASTDVWFYEQELCDPPLPKETPK